MINKNKPKILVVDDDQSALKALNGLLSDEYDVTTASSGKATINIIESQSGIEAVVMDIKMPEMDGITAARKIRQLAPLIPVIFHTGYPGDYDEDELDESERPFDYVEKASPVSRLLRSVRNAVEAYHSRTRELELTDQAETNFKIIGRSKTIIEVLRLVRQISSTDTRVMILGETGTGKELIARAIHFSSIRKNERLAIFNCNHKSPDLVESELFGHTKGAFTGAITDRVGLFEYSNGGTVFLDEIGDLDITTQAKILRVIETGEYQRVGAPDINLTNVRIICATHRDLESMVADGKFREDLYYRLNAVNIILPPLRERREDIPLLVNKFLDRFTIERDLPAKIMDQEAMDILIGYNWPGNVRQLLNIVESTIITTDSDIIMADDVSRQLGLETRSKAKSDDQTLTQRVKEFRRTLIQQALRETGNNVAAAARKLGVDRANLRKMIIDHGIDLE